MDLATLIGIVAGLAFMIISILSGGSLMTFFDVMSILIVIGGGLASTLISYKLGEVTKIIGVVKNAFVGKEVAPEVLITQLVELGQKARREGLLSLEVDIEQMEDEYIKQSLQLVVDGVEPETIREFMDLELYNMKSRHAKGQSLFKTMGSLFPAWGMIGTLIGLILLLKSLDDPSKIGPAMAVALITTFYGSVLANFVCIPIANKLKMKSEEEIKLKEMLTEGILSIHAGENPKIMEHKLKLFISPERRKLLAGQKDKESPGVAQ